MAIATDAATPANPSAPGQSAAFLTWTAGKHLGLHMSITLDGTDWLGGTMLTRVSAGRYRLDTAEVALAQVLKPETTDCRHSALEHGFCPAPAGGLDAVR